MGTHPIFESDFDCLTESDRKRGVKMSDRKMNQDDVDTYRDDLRELKVNNKPLINMLSQVAEDYKDTPGAEQVSELISERLAEVCRNRNFKKQKILTFILCYIPIPMAAIGIKRIPTL